MMNTPVNFALNVARGCGANFQITESGELFSLKRHSHHRIHTVTVTHSLDGKVSVKVTSMPHSVYVVSGGRFGARQAIASDLQTRLYAHQRNGRVWKLSVGNCGHFLELEPGRELTMRHCSPASDLAMAA
jgi:hypothetical protein